MTCPACEAGLSSPEMVGALTICPKCLASLVIDGDAVRRAVSADTVPLLERDRDALIAMRKRYRRAA